MAKTDFRSVDEYIPVKLIERIAKLRVKEAAERATARRTPGRARLG